jgi:hypothetical protein
VGVGAVAVGAVAVGAVAVGAVAVDVGGSSQRIAASFGP